jgi:hypothetical protein
MGDFDRNQKPAEQSQTKKLMMVGVLGTVLLGVVGMQMVKSGPSQASAAPQAGTAAVAAAPGADENPEVIRAALLQDPTKTLLVGDRAVTEAPPLRNPFGMSPAWRKAVTREVAIVQPLPTPDIRTPDVPTPQPLPAAPLTLRASDYKVNMIFRQGNSLMAMLNGNKMLSAGQVIGDAVVVEVRENAVVLRHKDVPNGEPIIIPMQQGLSPTR